MWTALDVFIGLALTYAMVSLVCSVVQEFLSQALNSRGRCLRGLLQSVNLEQVIDHAMDDMATAPRTIIRWQKGGKAKDTPAATYFSKTPHDIPPRTFASAVLRMLNGDAGAKLDPAAIHKAIEDANLPPALAARLLAVDARGQGAARRMEQAVTGWYADFTTQVQHWYARRAQMASLVIALLVAFALKVDTIGLAQKFYTDTPARAAVVAMANKAGGQTDGTAGKCSVPADKDLNPDMIGTCAQAVQQALPMPLGWSAQDLSGPEAFAKGVAGLGISGLVGIVISALAISLGARFWFDTLKSLVAIRTGGNPPAPETSSAKEDDQG